MIKQLNIPTLDVSSYPQHIPVFSRFQWINNKKVKSVLAFFLKPPAKGRKGYDKVLLFQWLMYKQLMCCSYRDLESMTGIDYSTFIKFRQRLSVAHWFQAIFKKLTREATQSAPSLKLILDSSFVESYSGHQEQGSEYNGYKKKNGYKLHQIIDFQTRLPIAQIATPGARADITWGLHLIRAIPRNWQIQSLTADKAYDAEELVDYMHTTWKMAKVGIQVRKTNQEKVAGHAESPLWRSLKERDRCLDTELLNTRTEIERYFSRKKRVFHLGEERTRHLKNFRDHCYLTSIMEILEWMSTLLLFFTRL